MRRLLDGDSVAPLDEMFALFAQHPIFWPNGSPHGGQLYTGMDYNTSKEEQRDVTFQRLLFLRDRGVFQEWLTTNDLDKAKRFAAMHEAIGYYDHSAAVKLGVHVHLWCAPSLGNLS